MKLLNSLIEKVSDHPVLFIFFRAILENDFKAIRAVIRRDLDMSPGKRTLDLGCGPGAFSDLFEHQDYVGADLNKRYIDYARENRRGTFVCSDARRVDLPDASFDQVLIFGLLHHLSDEDTRAVLAEAKRMAVPGGVILAIEDIPAQHRLNLVGHLLHAIENGEHIRPTADYRRLYGEVGQIEVEEELRSGVCDYYLARIRMPRA